jgi:hypothetical protein
MTIRTRWFKPRGLAVDDENNFWRCTPSAETAAYADPAAWMFMDSEMCPPSAVNPGNPMLCIADPPVPPPPPARPSEQAEPEPQWFTHDGRPYRPVSRERDNFYA